MQLLAKRFFGTEFRLFAFGCSHYGTESHDKDLWIEFLKKVEATPNAIVFGLGDYLDFARTAWRSHTKTYSEEDNFFESLDDMVDSALVRPFCAEVKKHCPSFSEKVVTMIEGNHHWKYASGGRAGSTSTWEICRILNIPYGGLASWVRLTIYNSKGTEKFGSGRNLNILLNHGQSSGSQFITSALGKLERQTVIGWRGVDILLSSHNHMLGHINNIQVGVSQKGEMRMIEHPLLVAKTGCFKKAYSSEPEASSYEERSFFKPHARGWFECTLKTKRGTIPMRNNKRLTSEPNEKWEFCDFNS